MTARCGSSLSLWSRDSFLSIGSVGSTLSIGSVGSFLSVGSVGSALSAGFGGFLGERRFAALGPVVLVGSLLALTPGVLAAGAVLAVAGAVGLTRPALPHETDAPL